MKTSNFVRFIPLLFLFCFSIHGQRVGQWKSYMAYQNATLVTETPHFVFAVYDGSLMSYSKEDGEVTTYSFEDGLHDVQIIKMAYSPETKTLVLVYENGNIDLFFGKNDVINISSIKDKLDIPNKTINNITIAGKYVYISAAFGIVVLDLERKEIKSDYKLGTNTAAVCQWGDYLYAATGEGLKRAPVSSNLQDKENWINLPPIENCNNNQITQMTLFKDHLVFYDSKNLFYVENVETGKAQQIGSTGACWHLSVIRDRLVVGVWSSVWFYENFDRFDAVSFSDEYRYIAPSGTSNDHYWIAWGSKGIVEVKLKQEGSELKYEETIAGIKVNSPVRNLCFYMTYTAGKLLVVGGNRDADRRYIPGTLMIYENGKWFNFDNNAIMKQTGLDMCADFLSVAVDPRDSRHYFVASWGEGVYEFQDTTFVKLYSLDNSELHSSLPTNSRKDHFVRVDGLAYDKNNNLYMVNAETPNGLVVLKNDNSWASFLYPPMSGVQPNRLLITRNNQKWVNRFRAGSGIFVLDDNNTIDNPNDDTFYFSDNFVDQRGVNIKAATYLCLAEDLNGIVWAGTDNGPVSFSSFEQVGRGECNRIISTNQYGDGYYLLEGQRVTAIAVDGGNRKWIGTTGNGIFVMDNSGETVNVENFTKSNSSLISNNITSIAINHQTGEVFIGTDTGLVSYQSDAIEGKTDYSNVYAFPNPVYPTRNNQVIITGLMQNSTVKITDMTGNLIKEGISKGGRYTWNCTNIRGNIVKAGIYLVFAATSDGSQGAVTKIMVIK
ncbi:MAG: hypothetical protein LBH32_15235 [Dysgonamonadaceae bacterium]|jgi:hypothetical protein|nr:hypothetical protein [Dysgonamonadaceae bacterium]